jgi:hypothetical protein
MRFLLLALALALTAGTAHAERIVVRNSPGAIVSGAQVDADTMAATGRAGCREGIGCGSTPEAIVSGEWADAEPLQKRGTYRVQMIPAGKKIARQRIW